ncbi:MAG: hypothetical protein J6127_00030 [Clostridiales bacterium]|nr:hypothetical protein [Clostridiales bacterium]
MGKKEVPTSRKRVVLPVAAVAVILALIIVFSIKWPINNKTLGDKFTSRIYVYDSFRLLTSDYEDNYELMLFRSDTHHDDEFTFEYDDESEAYLIYIDVRGTTLYLSSTQNNEIYMSTSPDEGSCRWRICRDGNTMYYYLVNIDNGLVLSEGERLYATLIPYDEHNNSLLMRLQ